MRLYLKNIGMLKEADIKLNGLSVIAGENDTGKSTISKILVLLLKTEFIARQKYYKKLDEFNKKKSPIENLMKYYFNNRKYGFQRLRELLFEEKLKMDYDLYPESFNQNAFMELNFSENKYVKVFFDKYNNEWVYDKTSISAKYNCKLKDIIYIQSPLLWDLQSFFNSILQLKTQIELEEDIKFSFSYPYLLWDLYGKLINKRIKNVSKFHFDKINNIKNIINGEFIKKSGNNFVFKRRNVEIPLIDVAHGIKSFGILQILLENGYISDKGILIFDEPEVHLHPKWQLEYAKLIISFVKKGIKILVNSHSPYMIEALKKYSEFENLNNVNFYLAEDNKISKVKNSNALTLEKIFEKLSAPFDEFDKLDDKLMEENG